MSSMQPQLCHSRNKWEKLTTNYSEKRTRATVCFCQLLPVYPQSAKKTVIPTKQRWGNGSDLMRDTAQLLWRVLFWVERSMVQRAASVDLIKPVQPAAPPHSQHPASPRRPLPHINTKPFTALCASLYERKHTIRNVEHKECSHHLISPAPVVFPLPLGVELPLWQLHTGGREHKSLLHDKTVS